MKTATRSFVLRRTLSVSAVAGGTAALMLAGISGASAHVGVTPDKTAANSYALLTFGVPHGCEESGTTKITITLPAELDDAQPTVKPNWTVQKVFEQLPEPKKTADGAAVTKRTSQIVYTAKAPLDHELRDALVLSPRQPATATTPLLRPSPRPARRPARRPPRWSTTARRRGAGPALRPASAVWFSAASPSCGAAAASPLRSACLLPSSS